MKVRHVVCSDSKDFINRL